MELRFTPTEADIRELQRVAPRSAWSGFLAVLLMLLSFVIAIYLIGQDFALAGWTWLAVSVAIAIAMYEVPRYQARRSFRSNPAARSEIVYTVSESGVSAVFSTGQSQLEWRGFVRLQETGAFYLLFTSPSRYWWFPKRAVSPNEIDNLRRLLMAHIRS